MGKYNFTANVENAEFLREKGIKDACIWSSVVMLVPWIVWAVPVLPLFVKWIALGVMWGLVPICLSFNGQSNTNKYSYQTRFPSLMSLPLSAVAYFSLSKYYPKLFFPYDAPKSIFCTIFLILVVCSIVNWIHFSVMASVDASISPNRTVPFTTKITEMTVHRSKNSTSYYVHYLNHRLEPDRSSISRSEYNSWKVGEVLQLSIKTYVINPDGANVASVKRLASYSVVTDADELLFEKSQSSDFVKGEISDAPRKVSCSGWLWFVLIGCAVVIMFMLDKSRSPFLEFGHPGYLIFLAFSVLVSILIAFSERRKLLKICDYKSEPYNVWCDKLIKKLVLSTTAVVACCGLVILIYNKMCSHANYTTESYPCSTESRYHKTKHGHYYSYHAIFKRDGENVYRDLEISSHQMDSKSIEIKLKKGLFGIPIVFDYDVYN